MSSPPQTFWVLIDQTYGAVNRYIMRRLWDAGFSELRLAHSKVFENLDLDLKGTTATALAERAQMTKQAMGELIVDLERLGYVKRVPDPQDRRAKLVVLTRRGKRSWQAAFDAMDELQTLAEDAVGQKRFAQTQEALESLLSAIQARLDSLETQPPPPG